MFNKENIERLRQFLFVALFSFPILSIKFTNIIFVVFAILTLIVSIRDKHEFNFTLFKKYGFFILLFVPYAVEFIFYPSNKVMQFEFEKKLLFLFAPIAFYLNTTIDSKFKIEYAVNTFISSVSILSLMVILNLLFWGNLFDKVTYMNGAFELRKTFEEFSGQHPIYYGLFSTTASLWILYYFDSYSKNLQWLIGISVFFMILLNLLIAAKMPLIILILGLIWIAHKKVSIRRKLWVLYFCSFLVIIGISFLIPSLRNRLLEIPHYFIQPEINNTLLERNVILNCSKNVFLNDVYIGVGARNAQFILDSSYLMVNFYKGYFFHFNSHNQFLTFGINYGIGMLCIFVGLLGMIYKKVKNYPLGFIFIFSCMFIMLTESILERQMGIYYFLFFGLLFLSTTYNKKETMANPK
ncbi:MAG: hypothetical protein U0W65_08220 [Bacteroidia bacterium]